MSKEGELAQTTLFTGELIETTPPPSMAATPASETGELSEDNRFPTTTSVSAEPILVERETPKATLRDVRAVRSLLYNRLLLEVVQRRIEKAEATILSYLLTQSTTSAQIGPYLVELDASDRIGLTQTETDGWYQLYFSELETVSEA